MSITVALAVTDGISLLEVAAPCDVFGVNRTDLADPWYDFTVCGPQDATVGGWFHPDRPRGLEELAGAHTVILPACRDAVQNPPADLVEAVRATGVVATSPGSGGSVVALPANGGAAATAIAALRAVGARSVSVELG